MNQDSFIDQFMQHEKALRAYLAEVTQGDLHATEDISQEVWRVVRSIWMQWR